MAPVGIVLVSHSRALAEAVAVLARQMAGEVRIEVAAGAGDDHTELGTDATAIMAAIEALDTPAGTLILMDLGSAILSAETALDLIPEGQRARVVLCAAPFVEGALAASIAASGGADLAAVRAEAEAALSPKRAQLGEAVPSAAAAAPDGTALSREISIADPSGLHLRPAAGIARIARDQGAAVTIAPADGSKPAANGASLTALLGLGARAGARLLVTAQGDHAAAALDAIARVLNAAPAAPIPAAEPGTDGPWPASPGIAIGPALTWRTAPPHVPPATTSDPAAARRALDAALASARTSGTGEHATDHAILEAQRALLDDPALRDRAFALIEAEHLDAAPAWARTVAGAAGRIAALDDPVLRARAADLHDAGALVLRALGVTANEALPEGPPAILIADNLPPSRAASLDPARVLGVIDRAGGPATHTTILLRAKGIPAIVGAADLGTIRDGTILAIDGGTGKIWREPDEAARAILEAKAVSARDQTISATIRLSGGKMVELWANAASLSEAEAARRADARGIGLLRTEFLFLDRSDAPPEDEQAAQLAAIIAPMRGRPVIIRTLDAGADKPLPFLPLGPEDNPFLGRRGLRATFAYPDLFAAQLRAILRGGLEHDLGVMLPMVTDPDEVAAARGLLDAAHRDLAANRLAHAWPVRLGMMVEVPAAALGISRFKALCDFYSIGTNDLTQYTLAADRNNPHLARFHDAGHEAVIALCRRVAEHGGRPVSVCGEAAGDPRIAPKLVAAGLLKLSMAPAMFRPVYQALAEGASGQATG